MNIARHIALIDELCFRPFPAEHGPSDVGVGGPGYHVAVLERGRADRDERTTTVEQYEKWRDALYELLAPRWGHTLPMSLVTTRLRTEREEIPEPWATLSVEAGMAHLWEVEGTGRWVAVAVADRDEADDVRLLAVVTETDPP
ncbi:hypothetical protein [Streptomyces resistomycificus]|uniref:Uncharacterized protein n=1 Tax=Streptomyces resistomycificus TaxID=67356 RepID=A0A0L8LK93_9ACTN|nr:hypothetical protein [Streptomyces resistomycificus]KOG38633.1 hypothetical protein ADK37_09940 [Streptomyces resistomycificus]KUO00531.1 hypothetical protein AQJ84_05845 [Streptomyces resistomycificus]